MAWLPETLGSQTIQGPVYWAVALLLVSFTCKWLNIKGNLEELLAWVIVKIQVPFRRKDGSLMPGVPPSFSSYSDEVNFFGRTLSKLYGNVYYIWHWFTPVVVLSDTDAIRNFYKDHFSHNRESDFTCCGAAFRDMLGESLGVTHGRDEVRKYRGYFEPYFTTSSVWNVSPIIGEATRDWIQSLPINKAVDLYASGLTSVPLHVLTCITYGEDVMRRHLAEIKQLIVVHNEALMDTSSLFNKFRLPFLRKSLSSSPSPKAAEFNRKWREFHEMLIREREEKILTSADGIYFTLYDHIRSGTVNLTNKQLRQTCDEVLLLNVDISYAAASFLLYDIAKRPEIQDKIQSEIDSTIGQEDVSMIADMEQKLPYLHMVMKESARMHPALGITFPEKTVKPVTDLGGYNVPQGTVVCVDPFSVNYSPDNWPEPEVFRPERFAPGTSHPPYAFFRFGLGPRKCLGYRAALVMIASIVTSLLQRFRVELADPKAEVRLKTEGMPFFTPYLTPDFVLRPKGASSAAL